MWMDDLKFKLVYRHWPSNDNAQTIHSFLPNHGFAQLVILNFSPCSHAIPYHCLTLTIAGRLFGRSKTRLHGGWSLAGLACLFNFVKLFSAHIAAEVVT